METKTLKGMLERIRESNAQYAAGGPAEKRVMIAKDVIAALDAAEIQATTGAYVNFGMGLYSPFGPKTLALESVKDFLAELPACSACVKGAVLLCAIARQNEVTFNDLGNASPERFSGANLSRLLGGVFSAEMLRRMEAEFEGYDVEHDNGIEGAFVETHLGLASDLAPTERIRAIMQNIIDNNGDFVTT